MNSEMAMLIGLCKDEGRRREEEEKNEGKIKTIHSVAVVH